MRSILILLILIVFVVATLYLTPWYGYSILLVIAGIIIKKEKGWSAFFTGFFASLFAWFGIYTWKDSLNDSVLSTKMAELFTINDPLLMFFAFSLIAALLGGFSLLFGFSIRRLF